MKKRSFAIFGDLNILLLGLVSLLNDFSSEMIFPILPLFFKGLGLTGLTIGLIGGLIDGLPNLFKAFIGYFSDKIRKRKQFIFFGYFLSQISKLSLSFAKTFGLIIASVSFDKLGKGIREAPRDALISESLPKQKGKGFGIQRAFDTTGAILGSLAVLLIVMFFGIQQGDINSLRKIIIFASLIGLFSLIPIYFVRDIKSKKSNGRGISFKDTKKLPKSLWMFVIVSFIFGLANFSYMFFMLKSASALNGNNFILPLVLYVFFNIFYAVFAIPFGNLSDSIGRRRILIAGYFLFSFVCIGFLIFNTFPAYVFLFVLYGLVYAMTVGNQRAFVSDLSPEKLRATSLGIFQAVMGLAAIFAGAIAGFLWDINGSYTFIFGAILSFISALLFLMFRKSGIIRYQKNNE